MNISMAPEFARFVDERVQSGDYSSASEVVRAGLRLLKAHEAEHQARLDALRRDVRQGLAQLDRGDGTPGREGFARLRGRPPAAQGPQTTSSKRTPTKRKRTKRA